MRWVRPTVILILTIAVVVGFILGKLSPEAFAVFATGLITFWFKSRDDTKKGEK